MTTTQTNPQLQRRAGRNFPGLFGLIKSVSTEGFKLDAASKVVLESDGVQYPGAAALTVATDFLQIFNRSGLSLTFSLYFDDPNGGSVLASTPVVIANGADGVLGAAKFLPVEGARLRLEVTGGSPTAGSGVYIIRSVTTLLPTDIIFDTFVMESTDVDIDAMPGVSNLSSYAFFVNFSADALTIDSFVVFPDGTEVQVASGAVLAASGSQAGEAVTLGGALKARCKLSGLPASGYVRVYRLRAISQDSMPVEPAL